jgi:hexose-6-phosphate dehydrogenase
MHCRLLQALLFAAGLAVASVFGPGSLLCHAASELQPARPSTSTESHHQVVNVIVVGATGDLAAKYLWVALFRLALEAAETSGRSFRFFAGASDTVARGRVWHDNFFDQVFARRVCGAVDGNREQLSTSQRSCLTFLEEDFKPSVQYTPLRTEANYRALGERLAARNEQDSEEGRMAYLAIPPQFFLQVRNR